MSNELFILILLKIIGILTSSFGAINTKLLHTVVSIREIYSKHGKSAVAAQLKCGSQYINCISN